MHHLVGCALVYLPKRDKKKAVVMESLRGAKKAAAELGGDQKPTFRHADCVIASEERRHRMTPTMLPHIQRPTI
jgi:hypothetical protein